MFRFINILYVFLFFLGAPSWSGDFEGEEGEGHRAAHPHIADQAHHPVNQASTRYSIDHIEKRLEESSRVVNERFYVKATFNAQAYKDIRSIFENFFTSGTDEGVQAFEELAIEKVKNEIEHRKKELKSFEEKKKSLEQIETELGQIETELGQIKQPKEGDILTEEEIKQRKKEIKQRKKKIEQRKKKIEKITGWENKKKNVGEYSEALRELLQKYLGVGGSLEYLIKNYDDLNGEISEEMRERIVDDAKRAVSEVLEKGNIANLSTKPEANNNWEKENLSIWDTGKEIHVTLLEPKKTMRITYNAGKIKEFILKTYENISQVDLLGLEKEKKQYLEEIQAIYQSLKDKVSGDSAVLAEISDKVEDLDGFLSVIKVKEIIQSHFQGEQIPPDIRAVLEGFYQGLKELKEILITQKRINEIYQFNNNFFGKSFTIDESEGLDFVGFIALPLKLPEEFRGKRELEYFKHVNEHGEFSPHVSFIKIDKKPRPIYAEKIVANFPESMQNRPRNFKFEVEDIIYQFTPEGVKDPETLRYKEKGEAREVV